MYQPTLGRFASRDPLGANGVDILYDNNWFGARLTRMQHQYGYANNNPIVFTDPSGLLACHDDTDKEEEKCSGACFIGNKTTITKCEFTKVKVERGSDLACNIITSALICLQLKSDFAAANKAAADDPKKYPNGEWLINKCSDGCDCEKKYVVKKGPQKFELKDRTIKSTGELRGFGKTTCIVTVTGTVEVDGGGFALVPCEKSK